MHDQKVHSFKFASALFPPIASVSTFDKNLVRIVRQLALARVIRHLVRRIGKAVLLANEITRAKADRHSSNRSSLRSLSFNQIYHVISYFK